MKKIKLVTLLFSSILIGGSVVIPSALLTSCSSNEYNNYEYDQNSQIFSTSSEFFDWYNIYIAIQQLASSIQSFNKLENIKTKLVKCAPNLFNNDIIFNIKNIKFENNILSIPIKNNDNVQLLQVEFSALNLNSLDANINSLNYYGIQANSVFFNKSLNDVANLSPNQILSSISTYSNSNLDVENAYIYSDYRIQDDNSLKYYIFLPNQKVPYGILDIYSSSVSVPSVTPIDAIKNLGNISNDWERVINWNTPTIETTQYKYIQNVLSDNLVPIENIISSFQSAIDSQIVKTEFMKNLNDNNGIKGNIIEDFYYCAKNLFAKIIDSWTGTNILDLNIFCGNDITLNNNELNGNLVLQFSNMNEIEEVINKDNFYFNINIPEIHVPVGGTVGLIISFNNSNISPWISTQSTINKTGYLTSAFNNLSVQLYLNDEICYEFSSTNNYEMIFPNSFSQSTIVQNVYPGKNILQTTDTFSQSLSDPELPEQLKNANKNYIQNEITKFSTTFKSVQNILLKIADNPTIYDFLISINNDLYNLIYALTKNKEIAEVVGDLFSNQNLSTFLFNNLDNIINLINDLLPESVSKNGLLSMLYDIKNSNKNISDMKDTVSNIVALAPMLEKVLSKQLGWLLDIITPLLENLSQDPNIFDCLLSQLPSIFDTLSVQEGKVGKIGNALLNYFSNLIEFANTYDPNCVDNNIAANSYKDIHVLDFFVNEFTKGNNNSLFNILFAIIGSDNSTIQLISNIVNAINFNMTCKIRKSVKNQLLGTYNYETINLYQLIQRIITSFFNDVQLEDGTTTDLSSAIANNIEITNSQYLFSYDANNNYINQDSTWSFHLKQKITINTLPIAALISKENINIDLSNLDLPNSINSVISMLINNTLPVNLVISPQNTVEVNFSATNSYLFPVINKKGELNWNYSTNNTINVNASSILNDSNKRVSAQQKCYGNSFGILKTLLSSFISTKAITNKIKWMETDLKDPKIVDNYNNSSYVSQLYINQLIDDRSLETNFKQWVSNQNNYKLETDKYIINYDSLNEFINKNFSFSSSFNNNNYVYWNATITSANYKLFSQTNTATLNIVFPCPVLIIKPDNTCYLSNNFTLLVHL